MTTLTAFIEEVRQMAVSITTAINTRATKNFSNVNAAIGRAALGVPSTAEVTTQIEGVVAGAGGLVASANLSDVASVPTARNNLGLAIGTNVQAYSANLTTFAGIAPSANVQSFLGAANYAAMRTALGVAIGSDVQAYSAALAAVAGGAFNGTVGATTPSTGAFTTVTASDHLTINGTKAHINVSYNADDTGAYVASGPARSAALNSNYGPDAAGTTVAKQATGSSLSHSATALSFNTFSGATVGALPTLVNRLSWAADTWTFSGGAAFGAGVTADLNLDAGNIANLKGATSSLRVQSIASGGITIDSTNRAVSVYNLWRARGSTFAWNDGTVDLMTLSGAGLLSLTGNLFPATTDALAFGSSSLRWGAANWGRASDGALSTYWRSGVTVGSITVTTTATAYNTSSDYRLKTEIEPLAGALDRLALLKPSRFRFTSDLDAGMFDGFLAHEVAEVVPEAVTGAKDAMRIAAFPGDLIYDDNGEVIDVSEVVWAETTEPEYQAMDAAKLVPLLTAALQEAVGKIAALEARILDLEAA